MKGLVKKLVRVIYVEHEGQRISVEPDGSCICAGEVEVSISEKALDLLKKRPDPAKLKQNPPIRHQIVVFKL